MSRYIDADALIDKLPKEYYGSIIHLLINEAPSIDIVRCKECVHGTWHEQTEMYICSANDQDLYEAEHFCSYGERRNDE